VGTLDLIPAGLRPAGVQLPHAVDDLLPALQLLPQAILPSERQRLLRRTDSKYVIMRSELPAVLHALAGSYECLTAAGNPAARYATVYFDTPDLRFLMDHLRGRRPRCKLRVRHYPDRHLSFLEVKRRTAANLTEKTLLRREFGGNGLSAAEDRWAHAETGVDAGLEAVAWTTCQRVTLLRKACATRITIDLNVTLGAAAGVHTLLERVLVEVKQDRVRRDEILSLALRAARAQPVGLSKYVAAMMGSVAGLPRARFAAVLGRYVRPEYWGACCA
jgi:hypothetical protein